MCEGEREREGGRHRSSRSERSDRLGRIQEVLKSLEMATAKLIILVGAGWVGSIWLGSGNGRFLDTFWDLSNVFRKRMREGEDGGGGGRGGGIGSSSGAALAAQVRRLSQELREFGASSRALTVVNTGGGDASTRGALVTLVLPAAVVGVAGYGFFWWKGWGWGDVMYVTRKNMTSAVTSMNKQLEHVSGALSSTKKHLTQRLDAMTRTLDENTELQGSIKDAVSQVRGEVERSVLEIENVQRLVEGLEVKIDEVQDKQNFANQGIIALVRCVESLRNKSDDRAPELLQGFHKWSLKAGQIERSSSSPAVGASPGFKQLQYSRDPVLRTPSTSSSTPEVTPSISSGERVGRIGMGNNIVIASNTPRTKMQTRFSTGFQSLGNL